MATDSLRVVIAGGGTGGHLYPGIAVARELRSRRSDARVSFAGTSRGLEARVVPREGFELDVIRSSGLKGLALVSRLRGAAMIPLSVLDAWRVVSSRRPHLVMGVGGDSPGPLGVVGAPRGIPALPPRQNAGSGLFQRLPPPLGPPAPPSYHTTPFV